MITNDYHPTAMLREFHAAMGDPLPTAPIFPSPERMALRAVLIHEELDELETAMRVYDLVEAADAIADLLYVVYGTAVTFGIDIEPIFHAVHANNMTKVGGERRADGKFLKPDGWQPPEIERLLAEQSAPL